MMGLSLSALPEVPGPPSAPITSKPTFIPQVPITINLTSLKSSVTSASVPQSSPHASVIPVSDIATSESSFALDRNTSNRLLKIRLDCGSNSLICLIDSGESSNFVSRQAIQAFQDLEPNSLNVKQVNPVSIRLADGQGSSCFTSVFLSLTGPGSVNYKSDYLFGDLFNGIILGKHFLHCFNHQIDWRENLVRFSNGSFWKCDLKDSPSISLIEVQRPR